MQKIACIILFRSCDCTNSTMPSPPIITVVDTITTVTNIVGMKESRIVTTTTIIMISFFS